MKNKTKKDDEYVYPQTKGVGSAFLGEGGLSLRDRIAIEALPKLSERDRQNLLQASDSASCSAWAEAASRFAYTVADAMLTERLKGREEVRGE